jgi:hypothetical protein
MLRQHTSAYVRKRQHMSAYEPAYALQWDAQTAYVSIRQHASAYVSIRQHTSAYVSIRQHANLPTRCSGMLSADTGRSAVAKKKGRPYPSLVPDQIHVRRMLLQWQPHAL